MTSVMPTASTAMYPAWFRRLLMLREEMNSPFVRIVKMAKMTTRAMYIP